MPEKDPFNYSLITYAWVIALATWGGIVSFLNKLKAGKSRAFNLTELIGELVTSAFAGMLTFMLCEYANLAQLVTAALVGISGHMGSRAIMAFEHYLEARAHNMLGYERRKDARDGKQITE